MYAERRRFYTARRGFASARACLARGLSPSPCPSPGFRYRPLPVAQHTAPPLPRDHWNPSPQAVSVHIVTSPWRPALNWHSRGGRLRKRLSAGVLGEKPRRIRTFRPPDPCVIGFLPRKTAFFCPRFSRFCSRRAVGMAGANSRREWYSAAFPRVEALLRHAVLAKLKLHLRAGATQPRPAKLPLCSSSAPPDRVSASVHISTSCPGVKTKNWAARPGS